MNKYKCPRCGGNQYSADPRKENETCIYCDHQGTEIMDSISEDRDKKRRPNHMDIKGIHATLKITLSPKDYVELLTLMIKDVEEMNEWGEKQKSNSKEGNDEDLHEPDRPAATRSP